LPGHGHNYRLFVTVQGEVDGKTGFVVDLGALDALITAQVIEPLDHQHLNHVVPEFAPGGRIPTSENILLLLWGRLQGRMPAGARLLRLRLHENPDFYVDYAGG
ncbi:MAG TPA: 6-carboxytetrahydropterin synthase, partial [Longimicrobium sp.]